MSRAPRSATARRDWGSDDSATPILHIDMDAFFVSVELLDRPELRGLPVVVGGAHAGSEKLAAGSVNDSSVRVNTATPSRWAPASDTAWSAGGAGSAGSADNARGAGSWNNAPGSERGVVSAASYEARAFGVNSAMPLAQAKRLCPSLRILPVNGKKYSAVSGRIMDFLHTITPLIEQISVDEAFLDVAGARRRLGSPVQIGQYIRREIRAREGVPASVGIANTKHLAKLASAHAKPDGLLLVPAPASLQFLHSLPVGALMGVGQKTQQLLARRGITTVADVALAGEKQLVHLLGEAAGKRLYALAMNRDERAVQPVRIEKSMSREQTFFTPLTTRAALEKIVLAQSHEVAKRLRDAHVKAGTVTIRLRAATFDTLSRSAALTVPTFASSDIYAAALRLVRAAPFPPSGVRLIGVKVGSLVAESAGVQLAFDDDGRAERMDAALDAVQARYGKGAVRPGSLM